MGKLIKLGDRSLGPEDRLAEKNKLMQSMHTKVLNTKSFFQLFSFHYLNCFLYSFQFPLFSSKRKMKFLEMIMVIILELRTFLLYQSPLTSPSLSSFSRQLIN